MHWLTDPQIWISLLTLTLLEIVLGIDNIIFISILAGKLPTEQQGKARTLGLGLALITRVLLLLTISWLASLTAPIHPSFAFQDHAFSWRDIVLLSGGLFLLWKSVHEIHGNLEGEEHAKSSGVKGAFAAVIAQIVVVDIVFSLDSVITAVGMTNNLPVMVTAVVLAMAVMMLASGAISDFVNRHPTIKILALSFLILVGVMLVAEGFGQHVSKGYIYFAMSFSFAVEMLNIKMRAKRKTKPVDLRSGY